MTCVGYRRQQPPGPQFLSGDWEICAVAPGTTPQVEAEHWQRVKGLRTAAAALRDMEQWSLAHSPRSFDAQDWHYRLRFDAPDAGRHPAVLGFDGLATLAEVSLNGERLLTSTNMFAAHECAVGMLLRQQGNELTMRFSALDAALEQRRPRPRWRTPMVSHQQLRWFRTTLLGRTPGWSPPAAVVGPWRDIWLDQGKGNAGRKAQLHATVQGNVGVVVCRIEMDLPAGATADVRLARGDIVASERLEWDQAGGCFSGQLRLRDPQLWWPHTHGEPALYHATVAVRAGGRSEGDEPQQVLDLGRVGFRTIDLDTSANGFSLSVNGVPVFCRGAGWTPLDPVSLRSSRSACHAALVQARTAGMNMLRIAGTTVYEEDHFYDSCDELGLLVWQDFMFANMDYPAHDTSFAASVELEARQQLQRLHSRPCLAVLCGNSEAAQQAAMWGAPRENWSSPLFGETLPRLCSELAPSIPYWPSSAHGGAFPHQANAGTTSYYGVGAYLRPLDDARRSGLRFATECLAFANIPGADALARMPGGAIVRVQSPEWKQRSPRDLGAGWDFDDVRDHYLQLLFRTDPARLRAVDHDRYLALGRLATAEVMASCYAEWRRPGSACNGALVLMLRDLWAGAGWGVVDDAGAPKACWHALRRVLQPLTLLVTDEGVNGLFLHVVNETAQPRTVEVALAGWRGGDVQVAAGSRTVSVGARGTHTIAAVALLDHFMDLGDAYSFGPPPCDAVVATLRDPGGAVLARSFHFSAGLPSAAEPDVGLEAEVVSTGDGAVALRVRTRRLAIGVSFEVQGFVPDDEHFHLPPDGETLVTLRGAAAMPPVAWVHALNSTRSARIAHKEASK